MYTIRHILLNVKTFLNIFFHAKKPLRSGDHSGKIYMCLLQNSVVRFSLVALFVFFALLVVAVAVTAVLSVRAVLHILYVLNIFGVLVVLIVTHVFHLRVSGIFFAVFGKLCKVNVR